MGWVVVGEIIKSVYESGGVARGQGVVFAARY